MHHLSKLTTFLFEPLFWLALLFLFGTLLLFARDERFRFWGRRLCVFGVLFLSLLSWSGLPESLIAEDERQYATPTDLSNFHGMIVLGGSMPSPRVRDTALPPLAASAERVVEPVALMSRYPQLMLLFAGGDARLTDEPMPEAQIARDHFAKLGVDMSRVVFETRSRNTFENASMSRDLPGIDTKKPWLLVTSAWHMTRAKAAFERAGWNVTAYPVDFHSPADVSLYEFSVEEGVNAWRLLLRERFGFLIYRLLDRA